MTHEADGFDLHKAIMKIPFRSHSSLFTGEKHLILPGQVYHFMGPNSVLSKRLDPNTDLPYHAPHLAPINQVDELGMKNDKDYRDAEKLESPEKVLEVKHVANEKLVRNLNSIRVSGWR